MTRNHDEEPEAQVLLRLHDRLAAEAAEAGILDVTYRTVDTPIGSLLVVATEQGIVKVSWAHEDFDATLAELSQVLSPRILQGSRDVDRAAFELDEYFRGERRQFEVPVDFRLTAGFRQLVQRYLPHIAYGTTASYKQVAESVGNPKAMRAVGSACATNQVPIIVPCHRVLRSDGTLGGFGGGLDVKRMLLALEAGDKVS